MILVDTGPLVALFDPRDDAHGAATSKLEEIRGPLTTTLPVLTEAFQLLGPVSRGSSAFRAFVERRGLTVTFLGPDSLTRAFELMARYADHPMDLADASLVAVAETLRVTTVFTLDRSDFGAYRARIGRSSRKFTVIDPLPRNA